MKELFFKTKDGIKIAANYYEGNTVSNYADANDAKQNSIHNSVLIIVPGWCMTKDSQAFKKIAESFACVFDVLCFDFRGHGRSAAFLHLRAKKKTTLMQS